MLSIWKPLRTQILNYTVSVNDRWPDDLWGAEAFRRQRPGLSVQVRTEKSAACLGDLTTTPIIMCHDLCPLDNRWDYLFLKTLWCLSAMEEVHCYSTMVMGFTIWGLIIPSFVWHAFSHSDWTEMVLDIQYWIRKYLGKAGLCLISSCGIKSHLLFFICHLPWYT